jgi:TonB family protein
MTTAFLLSTCLKATVILAAAFLAILILRRASASARYFVWTSALAIVLTIPLLSVSIRPWNVQMRAVPATLAAAEFAGAEPGVASAAKPAGYLEWALVVWLCGAASVLLLLAAGHFRLRRTIARAERIEEPMLAEIAAQLGLRRKIELRRSREADVPMSYGFLRPLIVLPGESVRWTAERLRVVLLHELIHVKRRDSWLCLIAQVSCAMYWFHPLAWLALARFRREQEQSCDDAVVIAGTRQSAYAEHLVDLARGISAARTVFPAALSMAETSNLEQRVHALLDPRRRRRALNRRICVAALSAIVACVLPLAALRAQSARPVSAVSGTVLDASGAVLPNATVVFKNTDGKNQEMVRSNPAGEYKLPSLPAGTYNVEVKAPGFAAYQKSGVVLNAGVAESVDVKLDLGSVNETIEVVGKGPRPQPVVSGTPRRIRVGGNVQATKLLHQVKPAYPPDLQAAGIEGTVLLRAVISVQGNLIGLSVINTAVDADLAKAAMDAVSQWRYTPTLLNGLPVEVATTIAVNFHLEH